ncbi:iron-sulfur cluster repair protein YtfE [Hahella sp. KA22]|uniref:iron-sulfur cluster repair protein YtfE n=1 Tax=Hahella sp. KA22 TaxID=1628392 RepID=UPI000FDE7848|nr:iron-sulfur cluster repair protein YtfE [Hahella sp. KA22]AZZ90182.1 iron-sulfur cluster repair protein YtfE [Hahella sp. KA22]QAY53552.1 iron-sulfur cluster repair protein YtfE [Hahella sp. KA22]
MTLLDRPVGWIARNLPGSTRLFREYHLDFCCGGAKKLRDALAEKELEPEVVLDQLNALQEEPDDNWSNAGRPELIDHILTRYHARHREQLPELIHLARRVEHVHGEREECPNGLAQHLTEMLQELESHMMKEENILFPILLAGMSGMQAQGPISVMRMEHDQHGDALAHLEALTNNITPPKGACNTWRALYAGLAQLRDDLMQHIHLENNILFTDVVEDAHV